jgi:hypothetical protein
MVLPCLLAVAACSTADYTQSIDSFAVATADASKALDELNTQVTERYKGILDDAIRNREVLLTDLPSSDDQPDCTFSAARCRLALVDKDGAVVEPYPPEPPLVNMSLLMSQISAYASNLQALLRAETAQKASADVNAALGSIQNLATTVSNLQASPNGEPANVPQFATPTGAAVNWVLGKYIETVKFKGLQHATEAAKPVIRDAAGLFHDVATFASDTPKIEMENQVDAARKALRADPSQANIEAYTRVAGTFDKLLISSPQDLFDKMAKAHDALADSLQGEEVSLATANARIEAFAEEAEQLAKILKDLRALADGQEG